MKNTQPIRKSVLSFDNQRTSPNPFGDRSQDFTQLNNPHFNRVPSANNINIEHDFDETININRQTPPLHQMGSGPFPTNNASMSFVNMDNTPPQASSGGVLGSLMGMFGRGSATQPEQPKMQAPQSYEPVVDEVPLLEELGINFKDIWKKSVFILNPFSRMRKMSQQQQQYGQDAELKHILDDSDLAGPLLFCLALGFVLIPRGKLHFGYIYGVGTIGCLGIYLLLNLMCPMKRSIEIQHTISVLGYGLLPMVFLGLSSIFLPLSLSGVAESWLSVILSCLVVLWSTWSTSAMFVAHLQMFKQRWLLTYPVLLVYATFALITVF